MKLVVKILVILLGILLLTGGIGILLYNNYTSPVDKNNDEVINFEIKSNDTFYSIGTSLEELGLIKSNLVYKIYIKINKPNNLQVGIYSLDKTMSLKEIIDILNGGSTYNPYVTTITIKEGYDVRKVATVIAEKTENSYDDVINKLSDNKYISSLIDEYWFLTDDILNSKIYYSLEGYLFPETYQILTKNSVEEVFKILLDQTEKVLEPYKEEIEKSNYTIHEIMTLASMIQSEGNNVDDFKKMASVFLTRLDKKMKLQSCASAYYGDKKIMGVDKFGDSYLKSNSYNTYVVSALPVGPISNPGKDAIDAVLHPSETDYLFFASDKSMKVYFSKTLAEHNKIVAELKKAGNWYGS